MGSDTDIEGGGFAAKTARLIPPKGEGDVVAVAVAVAVVVVVVWTWLSIELLFSGGRGE